MEVLEVVSGEGFAQGHSVLDVAEHYLEVAVARLFIVGVDFVSYWQVVVLANSRDLQALFNYVYFVFLLHRIIDTTQQIRSNLW